MIHVIFPSFNKIDIRGVFRKFCIFFIKVTILKSENSVFGIRVNFRILCIKCNVILMFSNEYCAINEPQMHDISVD